MTVESRNTIRLAVQVLSMTVFPKAFFNLCPQIRPMWRCMIDNCCVEYYFKNHFEFVVCSSWWRIGLIGSLIVMHVCLGRLVLEITAPSEDFLRSQRSPLDAFHMSSFLWLCEAWRHQVGPLQTLTDRLLCVGVNLLWKTVKNMCKAWFDLPHIMQCRIDWYIIFV